MTPNFFAFLAQVTHYLTAVKFLKKSIVWKIFARTSLKIVFLLLDGDTVLAYAVDVMMARAKRIYILIINVNKLFSLTSLRYFPKEKENTRESLGVTSTCVSITQ